MRHFVLPQPAARAAARQHGVISGRQLLDSGLTRRQIRTRIARGALVPVLGDTYRVGGAPGSPEARLAAATLAVPDGSLSHAAAGFVLDLPPGVSSTAPELSVHAGARHDLDGVTIHRCRDLIDRHRTVVNGLPCTTLPRTVIDLAGQLPVPVLGDLVDDLRRRRRLPITRLHDEHDRIARKGRAGTTAMRLVLAPRLAGRFIEASELEKLGLELLRRHGFPEPETEFRPPWAGVGVTRVDLAFPAEREQIGRAHV